MALVSPKDRGVQMVANTKKDQRPCRVAAVLVLLVVMLRFNFDLKIYLQRILSRDLGRDTPNFVDHSTSHKGRELLEKLRETSLLAADGHDYTFTAAERREWSSKNPCQSRSELAPMYAARKHIRNIAPNPMWDQVLAEYANLHRICTKRMSNLTDHILNATIPGCKFVIAEGVYGFGNRMLVTVSAMLYAIVSQRIILVSSRMSFQAVLCEPFEGSSWFLDEKTFPMPGVDELTNPAWTAGPEFTEHLNQTLKLLKEEQRSGGDLSEKKAETLPPLANAIVLSAKWGPWYPDKWFFCDTEQRYLSEVPWLYYSGCIYSIPDMYGSAPFGVTLQALFPDRMVMTRMLRSAFFPSDSVWSRFKHFNHLYFQHADRRVSIQLRFFSGTHDTNGDEMTRRVMDCALSNGILPKLNESTADASISPAPSAPITNVFIASLHSELHDHLRDFYLQKPTISGEAVGLVQISSKQEQLEGTDLTEEDRQAFAEILLLSFSDSLLVTPASTFGHIGQAYGGLTPWILRVTSESQGPSCKRGQTVDPCQQNGYLGYECAHDPQSPPDWDGLLAFCLEIDLGDRIAYGIQILDNHLSWQEAH